MTAMTKVVSSVAITAGICLFLYQGDKALKPARPNDMPSNAHFVQTGYNLQRNEPIGQWIACRPDTDRGADLCRITDNLGTVIFQGDFLPLAGHVALPTEELLVARDEKPSSAWVQGPAERGPVPVIRLDNGQLLVPAGDADALADRWARDPDELARIEGQ
jgi:hypothetical protein